MLTFLFLLDGWMAHLGFAQVYCTCILYETKSLVLS